MPLLRFAVNDARDVRNILRDEYGFKQDRILFLSDGMNPSDGKPTLKAMREAFEVWLPSRNLASDDAVLIFFAGHGLVDQKTQSGYLGAIDSRADDFEASGISVAWVREKLAGLPCRHKLVILDSCYSGRLFRDKPTATEIANIARLAGEPPRPGQRGRGEMLSGDNLTSYFRDPA